VGESDGDGEFCAVAFGTTVRLNASLRGFKDCELLV
jgi:hypothetical protein